MTLDFYAQVSGEPGEQMLETSEAGLIVHEVRNSLACLKVFLETQEKAGKIISPGIWASVGKAISDGKIAV